MGTPLVKSPKLNPQYCFYKLKIIKSKIHRYGVIAEEPIPFKRKETRARGDGDYTYLYPLDNYWTLDGAVGGSGAELINHSCEPNLVGRIMKGHILYMS